MMSTISCDIKLLCTRILLICILLISFKNKPENVDCQNFTLKFTIHMYGDTRYLALINAVNPMCSIFVMYLKLF